MGLRGAAVLVMDGAFQWDTLAAGKGFKWDPLNTTASVKFSHVSPNIAHIAYTGDLGEQKLTLQGCSTSGFAGREGREGGGGRPQGSHSAPRGPTLPHSSQIKEASRPLSALSLLLNAAAAAVVRMCIKRPRETVVSASTQTQRGVFTDSSSSNQSKATHEPLRRQESSSPLRKRSVVRSALPLFTSSR